MIKTDLTYCPPDVQKKTVGKWLPFTVVRGVDWRLNNFLVVKARKLWGSYGDLRFYWGKIKPSIFQGSHVFLPAECIKNSLKIHTLLIFFRSTSVLFLL